MPKIKVTYFEVYGRADPIRMMLHHSKTPFEDCFVTFEQWKGMKGTPAAGEFQCLPIVCVNGKDHQQTGPILRSMGQRLGYYHGDNETEAYWADFSFECWNDMLGGFGKA